MLENQLSRYGAISKIIPDLAPSAKLFLVSDSDDTTVGPVNLGAEFPVDKDGVARVYTTIQAAVNAATAGRGDIILVLPGYNHTVTADSWNVAGVSVIGVGRGTMRPTCNYAAATSTIDIGASNVRVSGLRFLASTDSIVQAVDADTGYNSLRFDNNIFEFDTATNDFRVMLRLGQPKSVIENNQFRAEDTVGAGRAISLRGQGADYSVIENNYFYGQFDTLGDTSDGAAMIAQDTTDTGDTNVSGLLIKGNTFVNTDTTSPVIIRTSAGYTVRGACVGNRIVSYDTSATLATHVSTNLRFVNTLARADSSEATI